MIALIEQHRPEVATLCSRFGVQSLEVFGSAADGAFDPMRSDIDFLVEFSPEAGRHGQPFSSLLRAARSTGKRVSSQD